MFQSTQFDEITGNFENNKNLLEKLREQLKRT